MSQEGEDNDIEQVGDPPGDQTMQSLSMLASTFSSSLNNLAYSMEHTMTTMMEGFMTRLDARRDAEPRQETDSEVAEASLSPAGMVHKQEQCDARGGKGSIKDMGRHAPPPPFFPGGADPRWEKEKSGCVG